MKVGVRKPSLKKSIKARTTGKAKRSIKKATIPGYGQKGMGYINDPKKAVYNKVYNKTTIDAKEIFGGNTSNKKVDESSVGALGCLLALIQIIVSLIQIIIYGGLLIIMFWFIINIIF